MTCGLRHTDFLLIFILILLLLILLLVLLLTLLFFIILQIVTIAEVCGPTSRIFFRPSIVIIIISYFVFTVTCRPLAIAYERQPSDLHLCKQHNTSCWP